ncbi:NUDIX domain-containing protein [Allokutzneria sp. NRRL B-24872]|uniref:NUDIX hydrolase n=1 Tax=Allokutzneria sp. NRRL B-24872 TaxID=1137961 RepID=UPI000A38D61C|nr:NUDIX domain-containing protein [Allokutzneria sp. NRRL B-24872]
MPELPEELTLPKGYVADNPPEVPAPAKDSATVVLLRDAPAGIEVFLLRRVLGMAFAGGMTAFPGGGLDGRDADTSVAWAGPEPAWWARQFGCTPEKARALVCAAVRETFEEAGVLLAGPDEHSVVGDTSRYAEYRAALVGRQVSLAQFLAEEGLVLRADLLRPWANWVTPIDEPRRYDTRFFIAALPEGQRADGVTTEAEDVEWCTPAEALAAWREGRRGLLPPTWMTLAELAEHADMASALAEDRTIDKIIPRVVREGSVIRAVLPGDPRYDAAPAHVDAEPGDRIER